MDKKNAHVPSSSSELLSDRQSGGRQQQLVKLLLILSYIFLSLRNCFVSASKAAGTLNDDIIWRTKGRKRIEDDAQKNKRPRAETDRGARGKEYFLAN
jgi:hypothetical protein